MRKSLVSLFFSAALLVTACEGQIGPVGPEGNPGHDGTPCWEGLSDQNGDGVVDIFDCRIAGTDGISCWDLNGNRLPDIASEDTNGDGVVDQRDCRGAFGLNGRACWDLDGNGEGDLGSEDRNGDGAVDVLDCTGAPGQDAFGPAVYVGSAACDGCHQAEIHRVARTGHGNALRVTSGQPPQDLQTDLGMSEFPANGNQPSALPGGYGWEDVSVLIGAWAWMARFFDNEGYLITCPAGDSDTDGDGFCDAECAGSTPGTCDAATFESQWNQQNGQWAGYLAGEAGVPFTCGPCHTTGFDPDAVTVTAAGDPMPGVRGGWHEPGVQCEACHGPGSRHVADPLHEQILIDRSPELCGSCHTSEDPGSIPATAVADEGFIDHGGQWNELFASKKHSMRCIDCHDPHQSARFADSSLLPDAGGEQVNPDKSIRIECETCHFNEAARQNNLARTGPSPMKSFNACVDCHMPRLTTAAIGDLANRRGDVRTHLFAINTDANASQFTADGMHAKPWVTLEWACRSCHPPDAASRGDRQWSVRNDAQLEALADGYHD